jgi:hypothetical protein
MGIFLTSEGWWGITEADVWSNWVIDHFPNLWVLFDLTDDVSSLLHGAISDLSELGKTVSLEGQPYLE